jgi:hypothetical protein
MKKNVIFMFLAVFTVVLCSCRNVQVNAGKSRQFSKQLSVTGFNRIQENGSMDVVYTQDSTNTGSVKVVGPKNSIQRVTASVSQGTLTLSERGSHILNVNLFSYERGLTVYVSSPDLLGVKLIGSGDFYTRGKVDTDNLDISLLGSGDVSFGEVICDRCHSLLSGSGDMKISRLTTADLSINCVGSGDASFRHVNSRKTTASLSGSGDVLLNFDRGDELRTILSGSGDITVKGTPGRVWQQKTGSGDINISRN